MRKFLAIVATFATVVSLAPTRTSAQTSSDIESLLFTEIPTIVTASRKVEKATDAPATVVVVTRQDIRLRGYYTLTDLLRDLPGMETIEYYFSEFGTLVPVRGVSGNNKIIVLVNGMRVNPPGGEAMMFRQDISVRQAEQVEIIYGPGSTLYGQDAISAVINIITKKPVEGKPFEAGAAYGLKNTQQAWASVASPVGNATKVSGFVQYYHSDLTDLSNDYPDIWAAYQAVAAPKGAGTTPKRWDDGLNAFFRIEGENSSVQLWQRTSSRSSSEGFPPTFGKISEAKWEDRSTVVEARSSNPLSETLSLESILSFNRYEIDPRTKYVWEEAPATWAMNDDKYGIGFRSTLEEKLDAQVSDNVSLVGGIALSDFDIVPKATIPGGADRNADLTSQGGSFTYYETFGDPASARSVQRVNNVKYQNFGAYVEANWKLFGNLRAITGVRMDKDTRIPGKTPLSPRVAAIYAIDKDLTAKYIFTQAFVSPPPYFSYNVFLNAAQLNIANPSLEPETATSNEVNLSYNAGRMNLGLSAFYNRQENLLVSGDANQPVNIVKPQVFLSLTDPAQVVALTKSANSGKSTAVGSDLTAKMDFGSVVGWGSYSYVWSETESAAGVKTPMNGISRHNVRLGATYAALKNLSLTGMATFRSKPEGLAGATQAERDLLKEPYELGLNAVYTPAQDVDLFVTLKNVTGNKYILSGIFGGSLMPQETLSGVLGVRYSF